MSDSRDSDRYIAVHDSEQRMREIDPATGLHIPGVVLYDADGNAYTRTSSMSVGGEAMDDMISVLGELATIGREVLLHLREMTGDDFEGDT